MQLDKAASKWLQKKAEIIWMQSTVRWALTHVRHRKRVWN